MRIFIHTCMIGFLTFLTQIGGIAYGLALLLGHKFISRLVGFAAFCGFYIVISFETPKPDSPLPCGGRNDILTFWWNFEFLQPLFPAYRLESQSVKEALQWLTTEGERFGVEKIFVEPHIASSLGIAHEHIRFQGCRSARHDDHIHFQIKQ